MKQPANVGSIHIVESLPEPGFSCKTGARLFEFLEPLAVQTSPITVYFHRLDRKTELLTCLAWTSWLPSNFVQVSLVSFHEFSGTPVYFREEMILVRHFLPEFACRVAGYVHFSSETGLGLPKGRSEISQTDAADDQQVHVAERIFPTASDRTINKGTVDTRLKRLQRKLECWQQPGGFFEEIGPENVGVFEHPTCDG